MSINRLVCLTMIAMALAACGRVEESAEAGASGTETPAPQPEPRIERGRCENFGRKYGPVALPPLTHGVPYEVKLADYAEDGWRGASYRADNLPLGLELAGTSSLDTLVLRGLVEGVGETEILVDAVQEGSSDGCANQPDSHRFRLVAN